MYAYWPRVPGSALKFHSPTWTAIDDARLGTVALIIARRAARSLVRAGSSASSWDAVSCPG